MTVGNIFEMGIAKDNTEVFIRDSEFHVLAHGNWYQDHILEYLHDEVESFTWQDDEMLYIDVKQR